MASSALLCPPRYFRLATPVRRRATCSKSSADGHSEKIRIFEGSAGGVAEAAREASSGESPRSAKTFSMIAANLAEYRRRRRARRDAAWTPASSSSPLSFSCFSVRDASPSLSTPSVSSLDAPRTSSPFRGKPVCVSDSPFPVLRREVAPPSAVPSLPPACWPSSPARGEPVFAFLAALCFVGVETAARSEP